MDGVFVMCSRDRVSFSFFLSFFSQDLKKLLSLTDFFPPSACSVPEKGGGGGGDPVRALLS